MANILQKYFPMIRTREEVWQEISEKEKLLEIYRQWNREQQEEFLDFCTGNKGIKILYDAFFKEILNPESAPERLEEFLSLILEQKVKILKVLPNDTVRIAGHHGYCDRDGRSQYCKCGSAEDRVSLRRAEKCLLFGRSAFETVQTRKRRERKDIQLQRY